jgi:hypothetical protein
MSSDIANILSGLTIRARGVCDIFPFPPTPTRAEIAALRRDLERRIKPKHKRPCKGSKAAKRASRRVR